MVKTFSTVSTRIATKDYEEYKKVCDLMEVTPHMDLKEHIESVIKNVKRAKEIERDNNVTAGQIGRENGQNTQQPDIVNDLDPA